MEDSDYIVSYISAERVWECAKRTGEVVSFRKCSPMPPCVLDLLPENCKSIELSYKENHIATVKFHCYILEDTKNLELLLPIFQPTAPEKVLKLPRQILPKYCHNIVMTKNVIDVGSIVFTCYLDKELSIHLANDLYLINKTAQAEHVPDQVWEHMRNKEKAAREKAAKNA